MSSIRLSGVSFFYKETNILDNVSLRINHGELVAIVGQNGTGKTTFMKLISGLLEPTTGEISIDGQDLSTLSAHNRAKAVSFTPQNPILPSQVSVFDFVMLGRNSHLYLLEWETSADIRLVEEALVSTGIGRLRNRYITELSSGELQRVMISMSIVQQAKISLLDEPTSNLDIANQSSIMKLILKNHKINGTTTLITMHDLTLSAQYSERMILLHEGKIHSDGSPSEVLTKTNIKSTYGVEVEIIKHPVTGSPIIVPC